MNEKVLDINHLSVTFQNESGQDIHAVRDVNFTLHRGRAFGVVGESGCGKSVTVKTILGLHDKKITTCAGEIIYEDRNILEMEENELAKIRGNHISMIFQDSMTSLNPLIKIGEQITEVIIRHQNISKAEAKERAIQIMTQVGINSPEMRFKQYPHEFSGGMQQRIMIAIALACEPDILLADEPTTALDVTIQAQILKLMRQIKNEKNMSLLLITHDLGVVANICDEVAVMYAGTVVEYADVKTLFESPLHPYTQGLLKAMPQTGMNKLRLEVIEGQPPKLVKALANQCPFADRCKYASEKCFTEKPKEVVFENGHRVTCHRITDSGKE